MPPGALPNAGSPLIKFDVATSDRIEIRRASRWKKTEELLANYLDSKCPGRDSNFRIRNPVLRAANCD